MADSTDPSAAWSAVALAWDAHVDEVDEHSTESIAALVDRVDVRSGERVLELAAGPGSLGPTWARLVGSAGSVLLSDLAPGMVAVAQRRTASMPNVDTAVLDASAIDQPDAAFDVVVCRMGLMFAPDPLVALGEIHRVLRPGGRMGLLVWGALGDNPWLTCVGMAAMMNGLVTTGPPIGPGEIFSLGAPGELEALAVEAGFVDVTPDVLDVMFSAESIELHVDRVSALAGPLTAVLQAASPDQRAALRQTAAEIAGPYFTGSGVAIPGRALLVAGRR